MKIVIVGAGKIGFDLARIMSQDDHDIIVIDQDIEAIEPIADNFDVMTVRGNGASVKVLEDINVKEADLLLAVTGSDELNIIACMVAKQFGVRTTVARVRNPEYAPLFLPSLLSYHNFGIDLFLNPEYLAAQEVFRLIEMPSATAVEYFADGKLSLIALRITEDSAVIGEKILNLNLSKYTIVAIIRDEQVLIPNGNTQLLLNDKVYVLGKTMGFHNLSQLIRVKHPRFKRIIIAGGSLISQYLVKLLSTKKNRPEVKIIESSLERCREISQELEDCSVIYGDATRIENLEEENLGAGDIFLTATGSDNSNLVACMLAKQMGVSQIICEVSREDYISLAETIGVTATITPRLLTVSTVLKSIKSHNVISISLLNNGEIEALELEAEQNSPITQNTLKELHIPKNVVIGSVISGEKIVVPRGDTIVAAGDRVIVFTLRSMSTQVERLFRESGISSSEGGTHVL